MWEKIIEHMAKKMNEQGKEYCDLTDFLQCIKLVRDWKGGCSMRVTGKIVDVSDTEVLTVEGLNGGRGEQLYRSSDVEDRHIKCLEEKVEQKKLTIKRL